MRIDNSNGNPNISTLYFSANSHAFGRVGGKDYDLRVSILPTVHGEKIVLRVLDKSNLSASIDKLGLDPDTFAQFKGAVDAPHGLILVCDGSGLVAFSVYRVLRIAGCLAIYRSGTEVLPGVLTELIELPICAE